MKKSLGLALSGSAAGAVNGFFGAGGGSLLLPLLEKTGALEEDRLFPGSLRIMVPICLVSLLLSGKDIPLKAALPYLTGSLLGGILAGKIRVSPEKLHRILGLLILLGGGKLLWS